MLVAAVVLLAGCGSSSKPAATTPAATTRATTTATGDHTTTTAAGSTRAQFVAEGDAICKRASTEVSPPPSTSGTQVSAATRLRQDAQWLERTAAIQTQSLDKLKALSVPAGDAATAQKIWSAFSDLIQAMRRTAATSSKPADEATLAAVTRDNAAMTKAGDLYSKRAEAFGMEACA